MVNSDGDLDLRLLDGHIRILRQQGATDEQLVTELAGHIFHESVHDGAGNMEEVFLGGRPSFGEITTVTAQLAYYLEKGYKGPTSYNKSMFRNGFKKVQDGGNNSVDYDIATYIGVTLILKSLREAYPELVQEIEGVDPLTACSTIIEKLSEGDRQQLIPSLKKAIADSTDRKVFGDILNQTRQDQLEKDSQQQPQ